MTRRRVPRERRGLNRQEWCRRGGCNACCQKPLPFDHDSSARPTLVRMVFLRKSRKPMPYCLLYSTDVDQISRFIPIAVLVSSGTERLEQRNGVSQWSADRVRVGHSQVDLLPERFRRNATCSKFGPGTELEIVDFGTEMAPFLRVTYRLMVLEYRYPDGTGL